MKENTRTQNKHSIAKLKKTFHLTTVIAFFLQQLAPFSPAFAMDPDDFNNEGPSTSRTPSLTARPSSVQLVHSSRGASTPGDSHFDPSTGFTQHPAFVGKFHGKAYEVWTQLSKRETELLRPLTAKDVPVVYASEKIEFTLGRGNFGATYAGRNLETRQIYAIKEVYGHDAVRESLQEGRIVHFLGDHTHIMPLVDYMHYAYANEDPRLFQVMPLAYTNGKGFKGMVTFLNDAQREKNVADSFYQVMMGLEYIHGKGVVHLDIKADNTLYMKDGTLRIADFGRAKNLGDDDQITDPYSLGDRKTFSPEIVALFRKSMGGTFNIVQSFSGKGADVWAVGLYVWELLEDNENNLFSTQSFRGSLQSWAAFYTDERFEELVDNISTLKGKFSSSLINLLRQVLTVDPEIRIKTPQVIKRLSSPAMTPDDRKATFEELIRVYKNPGLDVSSQVPTPVPPRTDSTQELAKSSNQALPKVSVPYDLPYPTALSPDNDRTQMNSVLKTSNSSSTPSWQSTHPAQYLPKTSNQPRPKVSVPYDFPYPAGPTSLTEIKQIPSKGDDSFTQARKAEKLEKIKEDLRRREELLAKREADLQRQIAVEAEKQRKKAEKEELQRQEKLFTQREADLKKQLAAEEEKKRQAQRAAEEQIKKAAEEAQRKRAIPQITLGHENVYERFLKGKLIYKPDEKSDKGRIELRIADLRNPLEGEFDLSSCGDAGKYLSINTGYRKGKRPENANKVEIWFAPHFLIEKNLSGSASHFKGIMGSWDARTAPVGTFFTWGGWDDLGWYEYIVNENFEIISDGKNLYEKWMHGYHVSPALPPATTSPLSMIHEYATNHFLTLRLQKIFVSFLNSNEEAKQKFSMLEAPLINTRKAEEDHKVQEQLRLQKEKVEEKRRQVRAAEEKRKKAAEEQRKKTTELEKRRRAIPQIAWGHEDVYERFLNGKLIYKPNKGNDVGRIELRIADLANPLEGEFDLSKCGAAAQYLSINTGYRKGKRPENKDKVEIWFAPHFLIKNNLQGSASHFKDIMDSWDALTAPVGTFFTWGGWDDLGSYDYATNLSWASYNDPENNFTAYLTATSPFTIFGCIPTFTLSLHTLFSCHF